MIKKNSLITLFFILLVFTTVKPLYLAKALSTLKKKLILLQKKLILNHQTAPTKEEKKILAQALGYGDDFQSATAQKKIDIETPGYTFGLKEIRLIKSLRFAPKTTHFDITIKKGSLSDKEESLKLEEKNWWEMLIDTLTHLKKIENLTIRPPVISGLKKATKKSFEQFGKALGAMKQLKSFYIWLTGSLGKSDTVDEEKWKTLLAIFSQITQVTYLKIDAASSELNQSQRILDLIEALQKCAQLKELDLNVSYNDLNEVNQIWKKFTTMISSLTNLQTLTLHLKGNELGSIMSDDNKEKWPKFIIFLSTLNKRKTNKKDTLKTVALDLSNNDFKVEDTIQMKKVIEFKNNASTYANKIWIAQDYDLENFFNDCKETYMSN